MYDQNVILVLSKLDRSFCSFLSDKVITPNMRQQIVQARNDADSLGLIHLVSSEMFILLLVVWVLLSHNILKHLFCEII